MQTISIRVDDIQIGKRHRTLSDDACERLVSSMKEIGLRQPISVRIVDTMVIDGQEIDGVPVLVAGRHRLEAAKRLGWSHIDCIEVDDDALRAELWEIDENLIRAELTPAQQAEHLSRRKEVWEALSMQFAPKPTGGRPEGFASDTAKKSGINKSTVTRSIARADALGDDIRAVANTSLDKGVELDALAKMTPEQRAPLIMKAQAGQVVSARPLANYDAVEKQVARLMNAWNSAGPDARAKFLEMVDQPVMDQRYG